MSLESPGAATSRASRLQKLRRLLTKAQQAGVRVRREWLGGETGGGCEIQGMRWLYLDQSLSIEEQIGQVEDALSAWRIE